MKNGLDMEIWDHKRFVIRLTVSAPRGAETALQIKATEADPVASFGRRAPGRREPPDRQIPAGRRSVIAGCRIGPNPVSVNDLRRSRCGRRSSSGNLAMLAAIR